MEDLFFYHTTPALKGDTSEIEIEVEVENENEKKITPTLKSDNEDWQFKKWQCICSLQGRGSDQILYRSPV